MWKKTYLCEKRHCDVANKALTWNIDIWKKTLRMWKETCICEKRPIDVQKRHCNVANEAQTRKRVRFRNRVRWRYSDSEYWLRIWKVKRDLHLQASFHICRSLFIYKHILSLSRVKCLMMKNRWENGPVAQHGSTIYRASTSLPPHVTQTHTHVHTYTRTHSHHPHTHARTHSQK